MDFLDSSRDRIWHAQMDIVGREEFSKSSPTLAAQCDDAHLTFVRGVDRGNHIAGIARR